MATVAEAKERELQDIGRNAYAGIAEMVAALECDFKRLAELQDERNELHNAVAASDQPGTAEALRELAEWDDENAEELEELQLAATVDGTLYADRESVEQHIAEDPLSIQIRSDWKSPGEAWEPEEFNILLGTGGPAVRLVGELNQYGEPERAWLEVQDWFTPWARYFDADQEVLLAYARQFYFGE